MDLPDAPVALEGFFRHAFFTVRNQEESKDFYVQSPAESDQGRESLLHQARQLLGSF